MTKNIISKIVELENCSEENLSKAVYKSEIWEEISPVNEMKAEFRSPNVLYSEIIDRVAVLNYPIELQGELVLTDKGVESDKGHLIEFNVRNNKDVKKLEGNLRIKNLQENKVKIGVFIHTFLLESDFLNLVGKNAWELVLRTKITDLLRNLEKLCKERSISNFL
ncbi:MAG: hypothetical protein GF353_06470 [Candidatus Lokiarchaeota archaeon]|nr:hypothetical protein [Candidatus Lokiarchaeota archaeon]